MTDAERERERLRYILESIVRIEEYTRGGRETFFNVPLIQDAVLRRLETLADATHKLSDPLKSDGTCRSLGGKFTVFGTSRPTRMSALTWAGSGRSSRSTFLPSRRSSRTNYDPRLRKSNGRGLTLFGTLETPCVTVRSEWDDSTGPSPLTATL